LKQAVILAGGKGTRLQERLDGLPKPLVDVGGVPLLERQIGLLKRAGFEQLLLLVSHAAEHIVDFCAEHDNWGLDIQCVDDGTPRGTAGATLAVLDKLGEEFLVMYGDTMLEVDLARFHAFHSADSDTAATLFLHPNDHPQDSDLVELDEDGRVTAFYPYPHDPDRYYRNLVNAALYWVRRDALTPWTDATGMLDFGKELFPAMLDAGVVLRGYVSPEYIKDAGTPERLDRVVADLASGKIERASLSYPQPVVFIDRDGTINEEVDHLRHPDEFRLLPGVAPAIRRLNRSEYRCCVITNQPVVARGECSFEGLREIHNKLDTLLGAEGAFIDQLYFCPHHPHSGFAGERPELKVVCDCRKPATGLIEQPQHDLNTCREASWVIGDSTVDIETARTAGIKSILVESGYAGLDGRYWAEADFRLSDLSESVTFVLDVFPRLLDYAKSKTGAVEAGSLLLLGGQSRSGKTHLASAMRLALLDRGVPAISLSLDRWLCSEADRESGVLGRYDLASLQELIGHLSKLTRTTTVSLPGYNKLEKQHVPDVAAAEIGPDTVLIVEGTVALALETEGREAVYRYHLSVDEDVRKHRLLREYALRGCTEQEAMNIYEQRMADEYPVVEQLGKSAVQLCQVPSLS